MLLHGVCRGASHVVLLWLSVCRGHPMLCCCGIVFVGGIPCCVVVA